MNIGERLHARHAQQEQQTQSSNAESATSTADSVVIGPRPYNRFIGNPPAGITPEEAFKNENGYDWLEEVMFQEIRDKINNLEVKNNELEVQVNHLMAKNAILEQELVLARRQPAPPVSTSHK